MDERRGYFRLTVSSNVELNVLARRPEANADASSHFTASPILHTMAELKRLDLDGSQLQQQIKDSDRALGDYLSILTRKIDTLAQFCLNSQIAERNTSQSIELSEGGIQFTHPTPLAEQQWLALMLSFDTPLMAIALHAQVIRCEPDRGNGCQITAEFTYMNAAERQQISQHIMRAQMASARQKPQQPTP
ncbi:PilZ domain-containing protein [Gilvimarinus agarilyticus]|uniref:PilZ domain-containing protein n=1 Tax=Gilvimarinus agarilyticus TaxID=679259 RepID=UPI0006972D99|nr:PilZ domain-containing protein [Gilvimarinus agarilyticus]